MKSRSRFVSNSSSSNFIVNVCNNRSQIDKLLNPLRFADRARYALVETCDSWRIYEFGDCAYGFRTNMDNFDYKQYAIDLGFEVVSL